MEEVLGGEEGTARRCSWDRGGIHGTLMTQGETPSVSAPLCSMAVEPRAPLVSEEPRFWRRVVRKARVNSGHGQCC